MQGGKHLSKLPFDELIILPSVRMVLDEDGAGFIVPTLFCQPSRRLRSADENDHDDQRPDNLKNTCETPCPLGADVQARD